MKKKFRDCIALPEAAPENVREALGLPYGHRPHILFFGGPGDVYGTFKHWCEGHNDPRTPVIAYSEMFYSLVRAIKAEGSILTEQDIDGPAQVDEFRFHHVPRGRRKSRLGYRLDHLNYARDAISAVSKLRPDLIVVSADVSDALLRRLTKAAPTIVTMHNAFWPMGRRPAGIVARLKSRRKSHALTNIHSAIATSPECARQLQALGVSPQKCFVEIPQILDRFTEHSRTPTDQPRRFLYLGRNEPGKGIFDLVDAFEQLSHDHPELTLDMAGTGSADAALAQRVEQSDHSERIKIHGQLSAQDVHALLARSDLLVCPTMDTEALALVVVEAAVHGVPSIASSIVPASEHFPDACLEFEAGNALDLAHCIRKVVESPKAYHDMQRKLPPCTTKFFDRGQSWGSQLYSAITAT